MSERVGERVDSGAESAVDSGEWLSLRARRVHEHRPVEAELYVRSLSPPPGVRDSQEATIAALSRLRTDGIVDRFTVTVWGDGICLEGEAARTHTGRTVLDTVERIESWSDDHGVTVSPFFERRRVDASIAGEDYTVLKPPQMCLVVATAGDIEGVFPCRVGDECLSVPGFLATVESLGAAERGRGDRVEPPSN